jgi:hypothetical protein
VTGGAGSCRRPRRAPRARWRRRARPPTARGRLGRVLRAALPSAARARRRVRILGGEHSRPAPRGRRLALERLLRGLERVRVARCLRGGLGSFALQRREFFQRVAVAELAQQQAGAACAAARPPARPACSS